MNERILVEKGTVYGEILRYFNEKTSFGRQATISEYQMDTLDRTLALFGLDGVKKGLSLAEESDYLTGRKGCEWRADFNWLIKPQNMQKVLNGNYRDFKYKSQKLHETNITPALDSHESSFDPDEFNEAALARGFDG